MCGIAGAIALKSNAGNLSDPLDRIVERMSQHLTHRGPDASGLRKSPSGRVALAHRRLAVIDLTDTGRQPMACAERFWVTFNGEIYNFKDLRSQLCSLGHSFRGESDTEVLLAAIAQWGIDAALARCIGMFALAVWDERDQILHLARDRMGEKPLYIGEISGYLFFASELRAFRAIPGFSPQISGSAVSAYLRDGCIPGRLSIYEGAYKVPPGHVVTIRAARDQQLLTDWSRADRAPAQNQLEPRRYWSCQAVAVHGRESLLTDERAAIDEGEELLRESVHLQAHADVPTGAFLSGGIDSSLVTALMQSQSALPVRTFTVAFDDQRFDESRHARAVPAHLGTPHEEFSLSEREIVDQVPSIVHWMDEPTANGSFFPVFLISRLARTQVTVVLSGDGGDELFAGYNRYVLAPRAWRRTRWIPPPLRRRVAALLASDIPSAGLSWWMGKVARFFGSQVGSADARRKLARVLASQGFGDAYSRLTSWWIAPTMLTGDFEIPARAWPTDSTDDLSSMLMADQINYLPDDNLAKVDRASMATSLETRLPLLDHRLVEFSWRLPSHMKLRGRTTKWLLRAILERYVPRQMFERPKMGFSVPIDTWRRGPLREWATEMLRGSAFYRMFRVCPKAIRRHWDEYLSSRGPSANEMWALVVLSAWADSAASNSATSSAP
jgi:asparagine synthase (glutamine-hydrolysing)